MMIKDEDVALVLGLVAITFGGLTAYLTGSVVKTVGALLLSLPITVAIFFIAIFLEFGVKSWRNRLRG